MKNLFKLILLVSFCFFVSYQIVYSSDEAYVPPYTFQNGQTADANQMNKMFEAIQTIINSNLVVMYDYGAPNNTSRVFEHTNSPTTFTSITYEIGKETWTYSDGHKIEYLTADSAGGTMEIGRREYNTSGVMTQNLTYNPPILGIDLSGPKEIGKTWGGGYIAKKPDGSTYGAETKMFTILAVEDVIVPAGTFENCIKVFVNNNYDSVVWFAEGYGMIKRIGVTGLMEMR